MTRELILPLLFLIFCLAWILLFCVFSWLVLFPWMQAQSVGQAISIMHVLRMYFRGLPPRLIIEAYGQINRLGDATPIARVEEAYLACKPPPRTAEELVSFMRAKTL